MSPLRLALFSICLLGGCSSRQVVEPIQPNRSIGSHVHPDSKPLIEVHRASSETPYNKASPEAAFRADEVLTTDRIVSQILARNPTIAQSARSG